MRALVTGATGFIGSHLVRHLAERGWQVAVLARGSYAGEGVTTFGYTGDTEDVMTACAEWRPDVVFHLASLFLATHTPTQVEPLIAANVLLGTQLLEAMRAAGTKLLVNAGTGWQNYTPHPPYDADAYRPVNLYAATKQAFETICSYYVETAELRVTTLRLFDSYGPGDGRRKLLRLWLETLETGQPLRMSPGDQVVDLVHVDDICRAFVHAAERMTAWDHAGSEVYAVSGGERVTLREAAGILASVAGKPLAVEFGALAYREREVMHPWEGPALPGWQPQVTLRAGLQKLINEARVK